MAVSDSAQKIKLSSDPTKWIEEEQPSPRFG
jgi:hypothetical protein